MNIKHIKIYGYRRITQYIKDGYFIYRMNAGRLHVATYDINKLELLQNKIKRSRITLISKRDFYLCLEQNFAYLNIIKAKYWLSFIAPNFTAQNINFIKIVTYFVLVFYIIFHGFVNLFHAMNMICYFAQTSIKICLFKHSLVSANSDNVCYLNLCEHVLPIYSILVPLYQEESKLQSILIAIAKLNYPKHKLEVQIIIEADDNALIRALESHKLPEYITVIHVPVSFPRTKPKALNYGINYVSGEYIAIYDAEDIPDPDQLLKAVHLFHRLPQTYACLQAKLNFYNKHDNLLTQFFAMEYKIWFQYLLKGLSILDFPVPLGGTSNHFKAHILRDLGYWDAYNVTEDAELGIRLYLKGYKTQIMDSLTLEESPTNVSNWFHQRSRWIKGFIQTFIIFFNYRDKHKNLKWWQVVGVYIFIGLSTYSFLSLPWVAFSLLTTEVGKTVKYFWWINGIIALIYYYSTALQAFLESDCNFNKKLQSYAALICWPCYFVLHIIATYKAIWEILLKPFAWNKTKHGISNQDMY